MAALYLADTNFLLRLFKSDDPAYSLVRTVASKLADNGVKLAYTLQNITEFWNTSTRPNIHNGFGLTVEDTELNAREIELTLTFLPDNEDVYRHWRRLVFQHRVSGVQVYDARIAAAMYTHQIEHILTFNGNDFKRFPGITAVHPGTV